MLHGGQSRPRPSTCLPLRSTLVTEYRCLRFQLALLSDVIGPVLYKKVSLSARSVVKSNS